MPQSQSWCVSPTRSSQQEPPAARTRALLPGAQAAPRAVRPPAPAWGVPAESLQLARAPPGPLLTLTFGDPRPARGERQAAPQLRHTRPGSATRLRPPAAPSAPPSRADLWAPLPPQARPPPITGAVWAAGPRWAGLLPTQLRPRRSSGQWTRDKLRAECHMEGGARGNLTQREEEQDAGEGNLEKETAIGVR